MAFDIAQREEALTIEDTGLALPILDEENEPALDDQGNPVTITICGMNSQAYKKAENWQRKQLRALGMMQQTPEQADLMQSEFVARCCKGWSGFTDRGESQSFSTENAKNMFQRLPFVQRQVEAAMGNHSRFLPKTSKP